MKASSKRNHFDVITSKCRPDRHHCVGQVFLSLPNSRQWMPPVDDRLPFCCKFTTKLIATQRGITKLLNPKINMHSVEWNASKVNLSTTSGSPRPQTHWSRSVNLLLSWRPDRCSLISVPSYCKFAWTAAPTGELLSEIAYIATGLGASETMRYNLHGYSLRDQMVVHAASKMDA